MTVDPIEPLKGTSMVSPPQKVGSYVPLPRVDFMLDERWTCLPLCQIAHVHSRLMTVTLVGARMVRRSTNGALVESSQLTVSGTYEQLRENHTEVYLPDDDAHNIVVTIKIGHGSRSDASQLPQHVMVEGPAVV